MSASRPSPSLNPEEITDNLLQLLEERGTGDYIGESISQLEHCLQCANFGVQAVTTTTPSSEETIIAALLHDVGQFLPLAAANDVRMGLVGRAGHELIGEDYLKSLGFGEGVYRLVGSHVAAKRYLTAVDASYYDSLSGASKQSLRFQGGPFQGEELAAFEQDPLKEEMVKLRKWDDQAKIVGIEHETPRTATYRDMILRHLEAQRS